MDTYLTPVLEGIVKVFNWAKDTMAKCIDALRNAFANNIQKMKKSVNFQHFLSPIIIVYI